jgi:hypothetical protein
MKNSFVRIGRAVFLVGVCATLLACSGPMQSPRGPAPLPEVRAPELQGARVFEVDAQASAVHIHVFRGGTLARLGHNHVVTSKDIGGQIWLHATPERSGFVLSLPVARLIVDDPAARAAAGSEFPGEIAPEDREGTRKNMLRAEVLDAQNHPTIRLQSTHVSGSFDQPRITTRITIKGVTRDVVVPVETVIADGQLTASGAFDILQTDFGIKPFSIGLGALEVQDRLHLEFKLLASERTNAN